MLREIVIIDEALCDGCGLCVPACAEGALRIVDGKARLVSDRLCDGLGACLGHCPQGAIRIERREVEGFDESAVAGRAESRGHDPSPSQEEGGVGVGGSRLQPSPFPLPGREGGAVGRSQGGARISPVASVPEAARPRNSHGCPGARFAQFTGKAGVSGAAPSGDDTRPGQPSALGHWPVQLRLLPPSAPVLRGARLLVAADCVPVAYADFHARMLRDHAVVIACPKLDDTRGYVEKLEALIRENGLREIDVVRMEVPCCGGILHAVLEARRRAESDVPVHDTVISIRGEVIARRRVGVEAAPLYAGCGSPGVEAPGRA